MHRARGTDLGYLFRHDAIPARLIATLDARRTAAVFARAVL